MNATRPLPRYPVEATRESHDKASRLGDALVFGLTVITIAAWAGYELGWSQRGAAEAMHAPGAMCPAGNKYADTIEHRWSTRGVVVHVECIAVARPY